MFRSALFIMALALLTGCQTVSNPRSTPEYALSQEEAVVFVRPDRFSILGTRSIKEYVEITYEEAERNDAGLLEVKLGIRNRGGVQIYDRKGRNLVMAAKVSFYDESMIGTSFRTAPVYETNWQPIPILRGDTHHFSAICLVPEGMAYQVTLSEQRVH